MDYIPPNRKIITGLNEKGEQKAMVAYVTALQHWVRNLRTGEENQHMRKYKRPFSTYKIAD